MKIVRFVFWLYGMSILAWQALRLYPGDSFAPVRFVSYIAPWLLIGIGAGFAGSLLTTRRQKKNCLTWFMAGLFLLVGLPYLPLFLPRLEPTPAYSGVLKVMSYSVMGRNHDYKAIAEVIFAEKPDMFFVQETGFDSLSNYLTDLYNGRPVYHVPGHGGFIAGRFPLEERQGRIPWATAETPYGTISLWTIHAAKALWQDNQLQLHEINELAKDIASTPGMKIVAGDFNTTDKNIPYKIISLHLRNAHQEAGWGFGFTFPTRARRMGTLFPFLRIDHIFYSNTFYALSARTLSNSGGSDHLPVVAELAVKK
jgi:endonuclease/exonuclease/phosphatase (EEP) superfamily protein YafD